MPSGRKAQHRKESQDKDKRIIELEWRLEAQVAETSVLRERLTATLDAMDALQQDYERELSAERQEKENAREKLQRFMEYASTIERERDECREALLSVVEKDPMIPSEGTDRLDVEAAEVNPKTIVSSLRAELEKERVSHAQTHKQAELEITSLRAQLSCREAELEAYAHRGRIAPSGPALRPIEAPALFPRPVEANPILAPAFCPEVAAEVLEARTAKNKDLEVQLRDLADKLHHSRHASEEKIHTTTHVSHLKSPDLRPCSPDDVLSPFTMTPRHPSTPHLGKSTSTVRVAHAVGASKGTAATDMQKLQKQIEALAQGIDSFEEQRRLMKKAVEDHSVESAAGSSPTALQYTEEDASSQNTAVQHAPSPPHADQPDTVAALRAELEQVRMKAAQREAELLHEIARLQEALIPQAAPPAVGNLLDDSGTEQSMDLGTPLAPMTVFWGSEDGATITVTNQPLHAHEKGEEKVVVDEADQNPENALPSGHVDIMQLRATSVDATPADDDLPLRIPLPPSPDASDEAPARPRSRSLRDRQPTPYASPDTSLGDTAADDGGASQDEAGVRSLAEPAATASPPPRRVCTCAERLDSLERELEETKQAVAQRDEELVELRRQVHELRMAALGR